MKAASSIRMTTKLGGLAGWAGCAAASMAGRQSAASADAAARNMKILPARAPWCRRRPQCDRPLPEAFFLSNDADWRRDQEARRFPMKLTQRRQVIAKPDGAGPNRPPSTETRLFERAAALHTERLEHQRRRAETGDGGLQHVGAREGRQKEPVFGHIIPQRQAEQNDTAGKSEDSAIKVHWIYSAK